MAEITLVIGEKGTGKSTLLNQIAEQSARQFKRRTLIIDNGQAAAYNAHGFIDPEDVYTFRDTSQGAIKRISNVVNKKKLIINIFGFNVETDRVDRSRAFLNGNLILEDAAGYLNSHMPEYLRDCIKSVKQYGLSLILAYHSFNEISHEILTLGPEHLFLKRSGDDNILSKNQNAKKLGKWKEVEQAFYRTRFRGLTPQQIIDELPPDDFQRIASDLRLTGKDMDKAKALAKLANGTISPSAKLKADAKYHTEYVRLQ